MENILGAASPHPPQNSSVQNNLAEQCVSMSDTLWNSCSNHEFLWQVVILCGVGIESTLTAQDLYIWSLKSYIHIVEWVTGKRDLILHHFVPIWLCHYIVMFSSNTVSFIKNYKATHEKIVDRRHLTWCKWYQPSSYLIHTYQHTFVKKTAGLKLHFHC